MKAKENFNRAATILDSAERWLKTFKGNKDMTLKMLKENFKEWTNYSEEDLKYAIRLTCEKLRI